MNALPVWLDLPIAAMLIAGAMFSLIGSWGLAKLSDFFKRLHGPTKATTLGVGCVLIASSAYFSWRQGTPNVHELLVAVFLFITAPVSAHLVIKAALKLGAANSSHEPASTPARPSPPPLQ